MRPILDHAKVQFGLDYEFGKLCAVGGAMVSAGIAAWVTERWISLVGQKKAGFTGPR